MLNFVGLTDAAQNFTSKLFDAVVGLMPHYESKVWVGGGGGGGGSQRCAVKINQSSAAATPENIDI
jgi:hypothetical protein